MLFLLIDCTLALDNPLRFKKKFKKNMKTKSCCSHLNFRYCACFEKEVP